MTRRVLMVCDVDVGRADATRTHTVEIARGFAAEGLQVGLVARGSDLQLPGVRFRRAADGHSSLARVASMNAKALSALWRERRTTRACYVRHDWGLVPVMLAASVLGYRVVVQCDGMPYTRDQIKLHSRRDRLAGRISRTSISLMAKSADEMVAVTEGIKTLLARDYRVDPAKVHVLPNGVDVDFFTPRPREEAIDRSNLDRDCEYVVFIGQFASWVDFKTMLAAFAKVASDRPRARLVLVGDGPMHNQVKQLIARHGLDEHVIRTGFVTDRRRLRDLLAAATVCLVAILAEYRDHIGASPVKLAEYFASGRAVVALSLPGVQEMIEESGAGITVPSDPDSMSAAIVDLLADPTRADRLGAAGRRAAENSYSWRSIVRQTVPLLGLDRADRDR